jgi:hypothetical protein
VAPPLRALTLDELTIDDERALRHVELYDRLKRALRADGYRFRAPARGSELSWDRALFLNLTFWSAGDQGDVLVSEHVPADVVVHVAWHHVARRALGPGAETARGLLLGEAIASASDLYLVGRLLGHAPDAEFLATQIPAMAAVAEANGLDEAAFEALLESVAAEPERAFEELRALLFDASTALLACASVTDASAALAKLEGARFEPLLHHFELSNWVLYARAYGRKDDDSPVAETDAALRAAPDSLAWLAARWL